MPIMLSPAPTASVFCSTLLRLLCVSCETGSGQSLHPVRGRAGLDGVSVVDHGRARAQQAQVAVHGVLIERNHQVDSVAEAVDPAPDRCGWSEKYVRPE